MFLAKIKGNVVSTQKNSHLNGHKLLTLRRIDLDGNFIGSDDMIALDSLIFSFINNIRIAGVNDP